MRTGKDPEKLIEALRAALRNGTGVDARPVLPGEVSGGQINQFMTVSHGNTQYFIKLNSAGRLEMFEAEMAGLLALASTATIRVPQPVCYGEDGQTAFLVLEHLDLHSQGLTGRLGEELAAMHRVTSDRFGWQQDNTIGLTPQINSTHRDWLEFWSSCRLGYQLRLAARNGYAGRLQSAGEKLLETMHGFFETYQPKPSLLHGDLWSGNYAYLENGRPVIYDPAVYFGDRETDLAMTELFGGFSKGFYEAYSSAYPMDEGYSTRKHLYNLYHVLNHLNMFGVAYLVQAESLINRLLSELG
jgi:fructosamine-3-kinase